jgi:hypothetical protein
MKLMILLQPLGFVPLAFVHLGSLAIFACLTTVAQEIRWVGPYNVNGTLGHRWQELQAIAFEEFVVVYGDAMLTH